MELLELANEVRVDESAALDVGPSSVAQLGWTGDGQLFTIATEVSGTMESTSLCSCEASGIGMCHMLQHEGAASDVTKDVAQPGRMGNSQLRTAISESFKP